MAWGAPKRNQRCPKCGSKGRCSCHRRDSAVVNKNPSHAPTTCTRKCHNNQLCGRTARGGVCPCPYC